MTITTYPTCAELFTALRACDTDPQIEAYYDWVDKEVLPAVMATGGYVLAEDMREHALCSGRETMPSVPLAGVIRQAINQKLDEATEPQPMPQARLDLIYAEDAGRVCAVHLEDGSMIVRAADGGLPLKLHIRVEDGVALVTPHGASLQVTWDRRCDRDPVTP
jgi:hypothetical protein